MMFSSSSLAMGLFVLLLTSETVIGQRDDTAAENSPADSVVGSVGGEAEVCSFCDTETKFSPDLEFAGISCEEWAILSIYAPLGDQCNVLRAAAVKYCGCPTEIEEKCTLCPNGMEGFEANQPLLLLQGITCSDINELPAIDGEDTCSIVEQFSYLCGCPGVVPTCSLCGQDDSGSQLMMERPDEVLIPGGVSQPDVTCSQWDKLLSLKLTELPESTTEMGRAADSFLTPCERSHKVSEDNTGIQLTGMCGCPGVEPISQCSPCPNGMFLQTGKEECQRLQFIAPFITNATKCDAIHDGAVQVGCCAEGLGFFTSKPQSSTPNVSETSSSTILGVSIAAVMMVFSVFVV